MPSCTNPLQINHLIKVTPPAPPPPRPRLPARLTPSPCKYREISSHSSEAACGSWKTHLPLLACGNASVLPGRADRSHTNVGEAAAGAGGGDIYGDAEKIVRPRQRLVVGVCVVLLNANRQSNVPGCQSFSLSGGLIRGGRRGGAGAQRR